MQLLKDIVEEDVEQRRKASLHRMSSTGAAAAEEIHDEENDGYDYDDEDFEVWNARMSNLGFPCTRLSVHPFAVFQISQGQAVNFHLKMVNLRRCGETHIY